MIGLSTEDVEEVIDVYLAMPDEMKKGKYNGDDNSDDSDDDYGSDDGAEAIRW